MKNEIIDIAKMDGKVPCASCFKGMMKLFSKVNDKRAILQCSYCGKKDDLELTKEGGKAVLKLRK